MWTRWEGFQNVQNFVDFLYGWSLSGPLRNGQKQSFWPKCKNYTICSRFHSWTSLWRSFSMEMPNFDDQGFLEFFVALYQGISYWLETLQASQAEKFSCLASLEWKIPQASQAEDFPGILKLSGYILTQVHNHHGHPVDIMLFHLNNDFSNMTDTYMHIIFLGRHGTIFWVLGKCYSQWRKCKDHPITAISEGNDLVEATNEFWLVGGRDPVQGNRERKGWCWRPCVLVLAQQGIRGTGKQALQIWIFSAASVNFYLQVFGSSDQWNGLGVFFDSFDNDNKHNNPYIMAMVNDGLQSYDHQNDGTTQQLAGCLRDFRNKPFPVRAKIEYYKNVLTVHFHSGMSNNERDFELCIRKEGVTLPKSGFFGISAATGGLAGKLIRTKILELAPTLVWSLLSSVPVPVSFGLWCMQVLDSAPRKLEIDQLYAGWLWANVG